MLMDDRKFLILKAIIDDYIMTAVPVGSRTISRKAGVGFSPATIRNEMSDLEELGYLGQPHTSAGRIPSNKAYRLYVDRLLNVTELDEQDAMRIKTYLDDKTDQIRGIMKRAAQVLSDMTNYTSVITAPQLDTLRIKRVQLVPVSDVTALMIVVTNAGIIKDAVVRIPEDMGEENLYDISRMLTEQLGDIGMKNLRQRFAEMFKDLNENRRLLANILRVMETRVEEKAASDVIVGGSANMLSFPEYSDIEKAKNFLSVLESKDKLCALLKHPGGLEFTIHIGPENNLPEFVDCSLVTASYRVGEHSSGTMGIIGPTRMNYSKVVSVLSYMGRAMTDMLSEK